MAFVLPKTYSQLYIHEQDAEGWVFWSVSGVYLDLEEVLKTVKASP